MDFLKTLEQPLQQADIPVPFTVNGYAQTHKLTFLCGRAKNFRSIGNEFMEISYVNERSTLVISDENGAGKSTTTVWLIYYAITGQPYYKKEKLGSLINSQTRKNLVVELEFLSRGVHYKVVRGRKPDIFELFTKEGDVFVKYQSDAANFDLQNYLWTVLGLEPKSGAKMLENACIMGLERFQPFLTMSAEERRLMVESVWDLGIFRHLMEEAKTSRAVAKNKLNDLSKDIGQMEVEVRMSQNNHQNATEAAEKSAASWRDEVLRHKASVNALRDKIANHQRDISLLMAESDPNLNEKYQRIQEQIDALNGELNALGDKYEATLAKQMQEHDESVRRADVDLGIVQAAITGTESEIADLVVWVDESRANENRITARLTEVQTQLEDIKAKMEKTRSFKPKIDHDLSHAEERLHKFTTLGECPTCEQAVSADKLAAVQAETLPMIELSKDRKQKLEEALNKQQQELSAAVGVVESVRSELTQAQATTRSHSNKLSSLQTAMSQHRVAEQRGLSALEQLASGKDAIEERIKLKMESEAADIRLSIQKLERERDSALESAPKQIESLKSAIQAAEASIAAVEESHVANTKRHEQESARIVEDINRFFMDVGAAQSQLERLNAEYNAVDKDVSEYDFIIDMLGEKEGKADVIRMYLPYLNAKINEYLSGMNMNLALELDEMFEPSMKSPDRSGQTLFSLSSGQRARVDLAIVFALRDVANLKASFQCNVLIMDEILESLSGIGVIEAVAMIKNKFHQNNLFIITQRNEEFVEFFDHQIKYGLRDGYTRVL